MKHHLFNLSADKIWAFADPPNPGNVDSGFDIEQLQKTIKKIERRCEDEREDEREENEED